MQEASLLKTMIRCDLGGARTLDPLIKSQLLYQLSYEVKLHSGTLSGSSFLNCDAKVQLFLNNASVSSNFFRHIRSVPPIRRLNGLTHPPYRT